MIISPRGTGFKCHLCTALGDLGQLLRGHEMGMTLSQVPRVAQEIWDRLKLGLEQDKSLQKVSKSLEYWAPTRSRCRT